MRVPEVIFARALASIHFVKYSRATVVKHRFPGATGTGPTMLTPYLCRGPVGNIEVVGFVGAFCFLANIWQLSQLRTNCFASSTAIG